MYQLVLPFPIDMIIPEDDSVFGILKEDSVFRRFLMRGKKNVRVEFLLLAMGYNVNKLHSKIRTIVVVYFYMKR